MIGKILNILLAILLLKGCSLLPQKADNNKNLINDVPIKEYATDIDSVDFMFLDSSSDFIYDSLSTDLVDSSLIDYPTLNRDIFHLIPIQRVQYGDTLMINLQDYIYSNSLDINFKDNHSFNIRVLNDSLFIAPLINANRLLSLRLNVNSQDIDIMIFSYSKNNNHSIDFENTEAIILKDSHKSNSDHLMLNYKYLSSSSNKSLVENTTWILFNNSILESKYYYIFDHQLRIMLPKPMSDGTLRIFSIDHRGRLLQENHTILLNNSILSAAKNKSSPYFSNMYYVLIDRFFNEKEDSVLFNDPSIDSRVNFHGGDFLGLSKKINNGYFNRLGTSNLILSPINTNPDSSFRSDIVPYRKHMGFDGSWPIDSRYIDSRFGTVDELKSLIADSHYHGLGIYLDFIVGHTHTNHSYHSLHPTWFTSRTSENKSFLPQLDFLNSEVIRQVSSDIVHWMSEFNFDGTHYSSTDNTSSKFWFYLNRSLYSEINRDYLKADNQIINKHGSQFNLSLYHKARDHFSGLNTNFQNLNNFIRTNFNEFGPINLMGTVTTLNSDPKFISVADGQIGYEGAQDHRVFVNFPEKVAHASSYEKLFMFFLMNNSLPGIPILFHGDEYGEVGIGKSDSKRDMKFQNKLNFLQSKLKNKISRLNSIRNQYPSLSIGDFFVLRESLDYSVWIKSYFGEHTIIFFNLQDKTIELNIPLPFESKKLISLLDHRIIELDNPKMASIVIPPYQSGIFLLDLK